MELKDQLTITFSAIALIISAISLKNSHRINTAQLKLIYNQKLPNIKLLSVDITKSIPNKSTVFDGSYCRIFNGESTANISLNNKMATFNTNDPSIENGFIQEIKENINKPNAYFTYFNSKPFLIANHATDIDSFIIDHSNVKMTFHNYGALISGLSIKSLVVYYKPEMDLKKLTFYGNEQNIITLSPEENNNLVMFFNEVTTNLNNSLCQIPEKIYENSPHSFTLLRTHMPENILSYNKLELNLNCWDLYNNKTELKITIEYNGNFFVSTTTLQNK
jgi:hypothetical protein